MVVFCLVAIRIACVMCSAEVRLEGLGKVPPVFQAVLSGDSSQLKKLLSQGADPNEKTEWGWAPLHQAMFARVEISRILLDAGADVNIRLGNFDSIPSSQWTPLFYAVSLGRSDLVGELIKHGANLNISDTTGNSPLFYATQRGYKDIADLLAKAGARPLVDVPAPIGSLTPAYYPRGPGEPAVSIPDLYQAILLHNKAQVEALLKQGANPNGTAPVQGWSPLHYAMQSDVDICRLLLDYGADPNVRVAKNERGQSNDWTPLFYAVYHGRDDLIAELLRHGAKIDITDAMGHSPLWYARDRKKERTLELLKAAGAHD